MDAISCVTWLIYRSHRREGHGLNFLAAFTYSSQSNSKLYVQKNNYVPNSPVELAHCLGALSVTVPEHAGLFSTLFWLTKRHTTGPLWWKSTVDQRATLSAVKGSDMILHDVIICNVAKQHQESIYNFACKPTVCEMPDHLFGYETLWRYDMGTFPSLLNFFCEGNQRNSGFRLVKAIKAKIWSVFQCCWTKKALRQTVDMPLILGAWLAPLSGAGAGIFQGPLLPTWINFNSSMDKYLHPLSSEWWNYLRYSHWRWEWMNN